MTLVPQGIAGLPARAEQEQIQTLSGFLLRGFDPNADSPLTWGLDGIEQNRFAADLHTNLSPVYGPANDAAMGAGVAQSVVDAWTYIQGIANNDLIQWNISAAGEITDLRRSRLYITMDLTEWIEFQNRDVAHIQIDDENDRSPTGFTTIWIRSDATINHSRSKTARTYLQGLVANRIQSELIDVDPGTIRDVIQRVLNADSGRVYSSLGGPCG